MKNYNVKTNGQTITIMADNYRVKNGKMIFEASGTIVKEIDNSEVNEVELVTENNIGGNYKPVNS